MFTKHTEKGLQTDYKAIEDAKAKELAQMTDVVKDEEKAKKIFQFLENSFPKPAVSGLPPR